MHRLIFFGDLKISEIRAIGTMGSNNQIFVDVAMVIKTMLLNPGTLIYKNDE